MRKQMLAMGIVAPPMAGDACTGRVPCDMAQIGGAERVVVGQVTGFEPIAGGFGAALVADEIDEVLTGTASGAVTVVWNGALAQVATRDPASGRVLIGVMKGGRLAQSDLTPDARTDLPSMVQPYVARDGSGARLRGATRATARAARNALE